MGSIGQNVNKQEDSPVIMETTFVEEINITDRWKLIIARMQNRDCKITSVGDSIQWYTSGDSDDSKR